MESAAELVNALVAVRDGRPDGLRGLQESDIESIAKTMQDAREARMRTANSISTQMQGLFAFEKPFLSSFVALILMPFADSECLIERIGDSSAGSSRLAKLPIPSRRRVDPFHCELPAKPLQESHGKYIKGAFTLGLGAVTWLYTRRGSSAGPVTPSPLIAPMLIHTIEGYRVGHQGRLLGFPVLFGLGTFALGTRWTVPIHSIVHAVQCVERPSGRSVEPHVVQAMHFALFFVCLTLALPPLLPLHIPSRWSWEKLSQFAPVSLPLLTRVISIGRKQQRSVAEGDARFDRYKDADVPLLRRAYGSAVLALAVLHLMVVRDHYGWFRSDVSVPGLTSYLSKRLNNRLMAVSGTILLQGLYSVWDLRRLGYVATEVAIRASALVLAAHVLVGPETMWLGLWSWREGVVSGLSTLNRP
jgi:hypothetical protein